MSDGRKLVVPTKLDYRAVTPNLPRCFIFYRVSGGAKLYSNYSALSIRPYVVARNIC